MSQAPGRTIVRICCLVTLLAAPLLTGDSLAAPPPSRDALYDALIARSGERSADARIAYGSAPQQFGELWLPAGKDKAPGDHPGARRLLAHATSRRGIPAPDGSCLA
jgi:hypothetical protein